LIEALQSGPRRCLGEYVCRLHRGQLHQESCQVGDRGPGRAAALRPGGLKSLL